MFLTSLLLSLAVGAEPNTNSLQNTKSSSKIELDISKNISGNDLDDNGIRDDIDTYLSNKYGNLEQFKTITNYAKRVQFILINDPDDENYARATALEELSDSLCLYKINNDDAIKNDILDVTFNTKERKKLSKNT